jgi:hypothetical protein
VNILTIKFRENPFHGSLVVSHVVRRADTVKLVSGSCSIISNNHSSKDDLVRDGQSLVNLMSNWTHLYLIQTITDAISEYMSSDLKDFNMHVEKQMSEFVGRNRI